MREPFATDECTVTALRLRRALSPRADADAGLIVSELVLALLDNCDRAWTLHRASARVPWWSRVVDYVESHLGRRVALRDTAAAAGVHPTHLARTVRARTHGTLGDYVRRRRVARAQIALRARPDQPLSRLALDLGFADHAHFSRTFRAITGLSPRQFRDLS
jgi:AraC family transcriptional regulator